MTHGFDRSETPPTCSSLCYMSDVEWTHKVVGGPWPKRIGLRCRIVPNPGVDTYPWTTRRDLNQEAVILVEDDPFRKPEQTDEWHIKGYGAVWSCCIDRSDIAEIVEGS